MKRQRTPQLKLLKDQPKAYGGELMKTRKGRSEPRPLDTKNTTHMILRSSKAKGAWSFKRPENEKAIREIVLKFAKKYGVIIKSSANVGNHLHFHVQLTNRYTYKPFIRAITAAIAMKVTGMNRWGDNWVKRKRDLSKMKGAGGGNEISESLIEGISTEKTDSEKGRFWDYRPYTRVVKSRRALLNLQDYIQINQLEGFGVNRVEARFIITSKTYLRGFENTA